MPKCETCYGTGTCPCGATDCGPKPCPDCYCEWCTERGCIIIGKDAEGKNVCEVCWPSYEETRRQADRQTREAKEEDAGDDRPARG